jgi:hypothetical protein
MSKTLIQTLTVKIATCADGCAPAGKLADAELHFTAGVLAGLKLVGFAVWASKYTTGGLNVTFPARSYSVNGERRSFALLRPAADDTTASDAIKAAILTAYREARDEAA